MKRRLRFQIFEKVGSTNDRILELGETDTPEGTTHIARTQSQGRGRSGHTWYSPAGAGLWMSTLLRPTRARSAWASISLLGGAAVREALHGLGIPDVELYWPNDLQVGRQKLGGILGEVRALKQKAWIALGIGVNIDFSGEGARSALPDDVRRGATTLVESGPPSTTDPVEIAGAILDRFWPLYDRFEAGTSVPELVGTHLAHVGKRVEVRTPPAPPWRGTVQGLGPGGELLVEPLEEPASVTVVTGGEVVYEAGP
jgi:BirA family biotin operon repressor/biotin-[acetyl-CoA-carboxylase] ligase